MENNLVIIMGDFIIAVIFLYLGYDLGNRKQSRCSIGWCSVKSDHTHSLQEWDEWKRGSKWNGGKH